MPKISALPAGTDLSASDLLAAVQSVTTKKITGQNLINVFQRIGYTTRIFGTDIALTNPLEGWTSLIPTGNGLKVNLPAMNATNSPQKGTVIYLLNASNSPGHSIDIFYNDTTTQITTLAPLQFAIITIADNLSANGNVGARVIGTLAAQNSTLVQITSLFLDSNPSGLNIRSADLANYLAIVAGDILTANRTFTVKIGDTNKTLDMSGVSGNLVVTDLGSNIIKQTDPAQSRQALTMGSDDNVEFGAITAKQQSGFTGGDGSRAAAGVQTTNATPTVLLSALINQAESITLTGQITGATSDHTQAVGGTFSITARRQSGGNVTLIGSVVTNVQSSSAATFSCTVDTGTQTVRVVVTGVAATTYNWVTNYTLQKVLLNT